MPATRLAHHKTQQCGRGCDPGCHQSGTWAETTELAGDYGYQRMSSDAPRTFAERLRLEAALDGQAAVSLSKLQYAYEVEEYAPTTPGFTRQTAGALPNWEDVQTVINALRRSAKPSARLKAQLLPHSFR